jgi:hypothetical protein
MEASGSIPAPTVPAVQKRQYRNNTLGWLGVVVLNPKGEETGISVEPQGTVWLSDAEAVLTARAPRLAKDNPFEEQVFFEADGAGGMKERRVRPLVPIDEARWVPQEDRYLPEAITGAQSAAIAAENATGDEPGHATKGGDPVAAASAAILDDADPMSIIPPAEPAGEPVEQDDGAPVAQPPVETPVNSAPAGAAQSAPVAPQQPAASVIPEDDQPTSWTEPPNGELVAKGELGGTQATPEQIAAEAAAADQGLVDVVGEETASEAAIADGEETGAAVPPTGDPVVGEFAAHEETGTPDAPVDGETASP